jgi:hypothetical protein
MEGKISQPILIDQKDIIFINTQERKEALIEKDQNKSKELSHYSVKSNNHSEECK